MHRSLSLLMCGAAVAFAASKPEIAGHPLAFEPNRGQAPPQVKWLARAPGYEVLVGDGEVRMITQEHPMKHFGRGPTPARPEYGSVRMTLPGSRPWKHVTGLAPTGGFSNYLVGEAESWRKGIPHYGRVRAAGVYDGIDLVFYGNGADLEYDFVVGPGADPNRIQLAFDGMKDMRVDEASGDLVLTMAGGSELRQRRPRVYQADGDRRIEIAGAYRLLGGGRAAFQLANYDRRMALVIDPAVLFTRFLQGSSRDTTTSLASDYLGNSYIAGNTESTNYPVNDASLQWDQPDIDGFVTKLAPDGSILFTTYLGGNDKDYIYGIAVDTAGVYLTGSTMSPNFPHQNSKRDHFQVGFVTKMRVDGNGLDYTTLVTNDVGGSAITVNPGTHEVYVTGLGMNADIANDAQVLLFRLSASGALLGKNIFGGSGVDYGSAVAVDRAGDIWMSGSTCSANFPIVNWQRQSFTGCTGFVAKWNATLETLLWSRLWGIGFAITVGTDNNAYVAGSASTTMYSTPGAFQPVPPVGIGSAFVTFFTASGLPVNSTYFGGTKYVTTTGTLARSIGLNSAGEVYVGGYTFTTNLPGAPELTPNPSAGYVAKFSPNLGALRWTKLLGATVEGIGVYDPLPIFPVQVLTGGGRYTNGVNWNNLDAFVVKLSDDFDPFNSLARIRSAANPAQAINVETGTPVAGPVGTGWWSAQWKLVTQVPVAGDPPGQTIFWIQNRWTGQYLNVESGSLQSTAIQPGWLSARWTFEQIPGTRLYRIRNVWTGAYINTEGGALNARPALPTSLAAQWMLERVI